MKKLLVSAGVAGLLLGGASIASADVSNNPTTRDGWGYCIANHIHNYNGDANGIGQDRRVSKGAISESAGNRAPGICESTQGEYAPISNNG